jgi:hypothetical protein
MTCLNDTDGDGDCHICHRLPDGCTRRQLAALLTEPEREAAGRLRAWLDDATELSAPTGQADASRFHTAWVGRKDEPTTLSLHDLRAVLEAIEREA